MGEWTTQRLEDCLEALIDYRGKSPTKAPTGIPVLSAKVVKTGGLVRPIEQTIATDYYPKWMTRGLPRSGDVVMTTEAPMGEVIQLDAETAQFALGQRIVCMRGKRGKIDNTFLRYLLISPEQQKLLASYATGTTVLGISQKALRSVPISYPTYSEQVQLGELLAALDDKIELNRRMNEMLEASARTLFRDWFVDFGPTRAKAEGRPAYLAPDLWSLFPDRLGDDGVPKGWEWETLGKNAINYDSKRVPVSSADRAKRQGSYPYHGATSVMDHVDSYLFDGTFVLVGEDGSVVREDGRAFTQFVSGKIWVNNHAHVLQGKDPVSTEHIYLFFENSEVRPFITGAVQLKLSQGRMNAMPFIQPGPALCVAFSMTISLLFEKLKANQLESRTLADTRDALLPKLMTGEIRVRDVEALAT